MVKMSSSPSTPAKPPKQMSSRLLTMKFMQRAAASASPSGPATPDGPSPKRQKLSPSTPVSDSDAIRAALDAEEAKRQEALDKQAAEAGETKWVLSFREGEDHARSGLRVVHAGFAGIDAPTPTRGSAGAVARDTAEDEDNGEVDSGFVGRRSFGKFNKSLEKQRKQHQREQAELNGADNDDDDDDDDDAGDNDSDSDSDSDAEKPGQQEFTGNSKERRRARRAAEQAAQAIAQGRKPRPPKEVNLNKLSSISGGGAGLAAGKGPNLAETECFKCGKRGHLKKDCPAAKGKKGKRKST